MQVLIAHRDAATRRVLGRLATLTDGGVEVVECGEGHETLELLLASDAPALAIVEWDLPELDGLELCRLACQFHEGEAPYVILLAEAGRDVAAGLDAGASDCVRMSAAADELRARIDAGRRIAALLKHRDSGFTTLLAERSPFDDEEDDDQFGGHFELQSVLVVE